MAKQQRHSAGLFDIRIIIGGLLGIYGVVLLVMGFAATSDAEVDKAGGINANLWAGLALIVACIFFSAWTMLRPITVDETQLHAHGEHPGPGH